MKCVDYMFWRIRAPAGVKPLTGRQGAPEVICVTNSRAVARYAPYGVWRLARRPAHTLAVPPHTQLPEHAAALESAPLLAPASGEAEYQKLANALPEII